MYVVPFAAIALSDITTTVPEDDAPAWDVATTYALGDRVVRDHRLFQSTIEDNLGNDPALEDQALVSARWLEVRYTNAYTCFDGVLANKTVAEREDAESVMAAYSVAGVPPLVVMDFVADQYAVADWAPYLEIGLNPAAAPLITEITGLSNVDAVMLFGVSAFRVEVVALDGAGQVLERREQSMAARQVSGYYEWFTTSPEAVSDRLVFPELPAATARLIVALEGASVILGEIAIGRSIYVGRMLAEKTSGRVVTASRYEVNEFGVTKLTKRPSRIEMTYGVYTSSEGWAGILPRLLDLTGGLVGVYSEAGQPSLINMGVMSEPIWGEDDPDGYFYSFNIKGMT